VKERFLAYIEFEKRYSPHTVIAYRTDLDQFAAYLSQVFQLEEIHAASHIMIRSWLVEQTELKISPRSLHRKISVLRSLFRFALRERLIESNPMELVIAPKLSKKLPVYVEKSKMDFLFSEVDFGLGFSGTRNRMILELFYASGIRLSEMIGLKEQDVDFSNSTIRVMGKRNKERIIPFSSGTAKLLHEYINFKRGVNLQSDKLFITDHGDPLYPKMVYLLVKKYLGMATTVRKRSPHVLRHTFATHLLNNGADLNAVKELLGHSSLAATQVYTHNTIEKLKNVYNQAHPKA
jgi:integrase/recombinase XerC